MATRRFGYGSGLAFVLGLLCLSFAVLAEPYGWAWLLAGSLLLALAFGLWFDSDRVR